MSVVLTANLRLAFQMATDSDKKDIKTKDAAEVVGKKRKTDSGAASAAATEEVTSDAKSDVKSVTLRSSPRVMAVIRAMEAVESEDDFGKDFGEADYDELHKLVDNQFMDLAQSARDIARSHAAEKRVRERLLWYSDLDSLKLPGVPDGELKRNVDTILGNLDMHSDLEFGISEHVNDVRSVVDGWRRKVELNGRQVTASCEVAEVCAAAHEHYDTIVPSLDSLHADLEMPHLPRELLLDIVLAVFDHASNDGYHNLDDYGFKCEQTWQQAIAASCPAGKTGVLMHVAAPHYASYPEDAFERRADTAKGEKWSVLKTRAPQLLSFPGGPADSSSDDDD